MGDQDNSDLEGNTSEIYTSEDTVALYAERARTDELFPAEKKIVERYFTKSDASVLDVGCGAGRVSSTLHEMGFDVIGTDISKPMIEEARNQFSEIDFYVDDISNSNLDTSSFDYIIFSYVGIDFILPKKRRIKVLRELHRLLKPSGILAFSSHNSWHTLPAALLGNWSKMKDLYFTQKNLDRLFSRNKIESIEEGQVEIYMSSPVHQWIQLRKCGFTPIDIVGRNDNIKRFFENQPYYVAKN